MADTPPIAMVLSAIPVEYQAMQAHLLYRREEPHPAGTIFTVGSLPNSRWQVMLAEVGTGNSQAAILTERAIRYFRPDLVMFVGIAGRLHSDLRRGDVVVATKIYAIHGGKEGKTGFRPRPESWQSDHTCDQKARRVAAQDTWKDLLSGWSRSPATVHFRPIASGEVVLDAQESELKRRLDRDYEDAAVIEMEGAGVARACDLNRVPMMNIRGVSDYAAGRKESTDRAGWQRRAARNAAAFAVTLLAELPAMRRAPDPEVADEVERELLSGTTDEQLAAIAALATGHHVDVVPLLVKAFNVILDPDVSCRIIWALAELGTVAARNALQALKPRYPIEELLIREALDAWPELPNQGDALP
ncbi:MAG: 5'-methylthioadenosine/S-adenosylhomocysteine nucleosidase [Labedaea sp.]